MINFDKFAYFCQSQLATGDYDAHIPALAHLTQAGKYGPPTEQSVWLGLMYMAFYNEASAWHWVNHIADPGSVAGNALPIETQRRNLYGGRITQHLLDLRTMQLCTPWLVRLQACQTWSALLELLEEPYGNGRWASYTTADLMLELAQLSLEPDLFSIARSSGPKAGLWRLGVEQNEYGAGRVRYALEETLGVKIKVSHLESLLCDWSGMCKGTFYAGRNIDRQLGRIYKVQAITGVRYDELWDMRRAVFPEYSLGELGDRWDGINKDRLRHYQETGEVLLPGEQRS